MSKNLKTSEYQNYEIFGEDDLYIIKDKVRKNIINWTILMY